MKKSREGSENECGLIEMDRCAVNERERVASKVLVGSPRRQGERECRRRCSESERKVR